MKVRQSPKVLSLSSSIKLIDTTRNPWTASKVSLITTCKHQRSIRCSQLLRAQPLEVDQRDTLKLLLPSSLEVKWRFTTRDHRTTIAMMLISSEPAPKKWKLTAVAKVDTSQWEWLTLETSAGVADPLATKLEITEITLSTSSLLAAAAKPLSVDLKSKLISVQTLFYHKLLQRSWQSALTTTRLPNRNTCRLESNAAHTWTTSEMFCHSTLIRRWLIDLTRQPASSQMDQPPTIAPVSIRTRHATSRYSTSQTPQRRSSGIARESEIEYMNMIQTKHDIATRIKRWYFQCVRCLR